MNVPKQEKQELLEEKLSKLSGGRKSLAAEEKEARPKRRG